MSGARPIRVVLFTNVLAPYRLPVFRALAGLEGISLTIWLCAESEVSRHWDVGWEREPFRVEVLKGWTTSKLDHVTGHYAIRHFRPTVACRLLSERPDVLVLGDGSLSRYLAAMAAYWLKVPYVFWSSEVPAIRSRWWWARWLLFRGTVRGAAAWLAASTTTARYLISVGADPARTVLATNSLDSLSLEAAARDLLPRRKALRDRLGVREGDDVLLFVGRLVPFKRPELAVDTLASCLENGLSVKLWMAGDGPLLGGLRQRAERRGVSSQVSWLGHLEPTALYERYVAADVLLACSAMEAWGFMVQEALYFGLPVVASDTVASAPDLIRCEEAIVPHDSSPGRFAEAVRAVVGVRWEPGRERLLADWQPEDQAARFLEAIWLGFESRAPCLDASLVTRGSTDSG